MKPLLSIQFLQELAWLAGVIDGEGCIGFTTTLTKKHQKAYQPAVRIGNTDFLMIEKASEIFKKYSKNGVDYGKVTRKSIGKDNSVRKNYYEIGLKRMEDLKDLLSDLVSFLTTKKKLALEFIQYCEHRLPNLRKGKHQRNYDEWELDFIKDHRPEIRNYNKVKAGTPAAKT